jgi:pimeloyl-ACP methyl ester carboxylesterase
MTKVLRQVGIVLLATLCAVPALAAAPEGTWIGGFKSRHDWVFMKVVLTGSGSAMSGRADLPVQGEYDLALSRVGARGFAVTFEVPGRDANLLFEGTQSGDRIKGSVRQGFGFSTFELIREVPATEAEFAAFSGHFAGSDDRPLLVYFSPSGPAYVDFATGRMGTLFRTDVDTFVSGPTLLAGYPVEVTLTFARDAGGAVTAVTREARGRSQRLLRATPYRTESVRFQSETANLGGWLLIPNSPGPHPAIVMIHGSGPATRQSLLPFADVFARHGIAVLVHDKRGSGQSTGSYSRATFEELAQDALAGVALLKRHPDVDGARIGLQGASLGGWVAPLAASLSTDVKFVIVEAAPATTPAEHERARVERQMHADDVDRETVVRALAYMDQKFQVARTGEGWDALVAASDRATREGWASYVNVPSTLDNLQWHWTHILSWDPRPVLERLTIPVLALYGELDTIVSPEVHVRRLQDALTRYGNKDVTVKVLPKANHHFFAASTGGPAETGRLAQFVPGYFETRVAWVLDRMEPSASPR